jgi:hypothetical protein
VPVSGSSNWKGLINDRGAGGQSLPRWKGHVLRRLAWVFPPLLAFSLLASSTLAAAQAIAAPASQRPDESTPQFGSINPYLGLTIDEIEIPGLSTEDAASP